MKKLLIALIVFLLPLQSLAVGFPIPMIGVCGPKENTQKILKQFGRVPFAEADSSIRVTPDKALPGIIRIFVNPQTWEYSIIMTNPDDTLWCLIAEGSNFRSSLLGAPI
jgi:hypothetical protein